MALDLSTLSDYAWADIAKAAKHAMVASALGGNRMSINGKDIGRITIEEAKALYDFAQAMLASEDAGGGAALAQFGDPV